MRTVRVGVIKPEVFRQRMRDVAAGKYKLTADDPKIWFSSFKSCAELLCDNNIKLMNLIATKKPESINALAALSGRTQGNLSRTLHKLSDFKFIELIKDKNTIRPVAVLVNYEIVINQDYLGIAI